jgi:hypothetical protein
MGAPSIDANLHLPPGFRVEFVARSGVWYRSELVVEVAIEYGDGMSDIPHQI